VRPSPARPDQARDDDTATTRGSRSDTFRGSGAPSSFVPGLVPGIHGNPQGMCRGSFVAGPSPATNANVLLDKNLSVFLGPRSASQHGALRYSRITGRGPSLAKYTPADMTTIPTQLDAVGHSPRRGMASNADSAGTNAPKAEPPEAPRMRTARP
jgi:hypothetical protein